MLKRTLRPLILLALLVAVTVAPSRVAAQNTVPLEGNPSYTVDGVLTIQAIEGIIVNILAVAVTGIGFAGFVMMIVGSFQYLMSGGNSKGVEGGKNTLTYAIVGLIVALSSWIILDFIARFTGIDAIRVLNICYGLIEC
jgi:hypothetical protein